MKEYININKCSMFEQIMLYLMSTMKEDDERENLLKEGWTPIGEIERYGRFGIDFQKAENNEWMDMCGIEDKDDLWELEGQFQKVAYESAVLFEMLKENMEKLKNLK